MEVTVIDVSGPAAHFRKVYGTNTAMSYALPPRTTICGLLAAVLGTAKDSYHEQTKPALLRVGVALTTPIRRTFHRVNNLKITSSGDFRGRDQHTQTPFEILTGMHPAKDMVSYRFFLSPGSDGDTFYQLCKQRLQDRAFVFAPCLGAAFCPAYFGIPKTYAQASVQQIDAGEPLNLMSAFNRDSLVGFDTERLRNVSLDEDVYPLNFESDGRRKLGASIKLIHSTSGMPLPVILKEKAYRIHTDEDLVDFTFLEHAKDEN